MKLIKEFFIHLIHLQGVKIIGLKSFNDHNSYFEIIKKTIVPAE
jgi:hypothetical protein